MLTVVDPTTGAVTDEVPSLGPSDAAAVIDRGADAFDGWRRRSYAERADVLRAVADRMRKDVDTLAPIMTEEMGKPIKEARGEVEKSAWAAEHYADHAEEYLAPVDLGSDATRSYVQHLPLGTVLGILPWNSPFWLAFRFCAPALMAGNTCVLKHDPHVPRCAQAIADLFDESVGAPPGIMQALLVDTDGVEAAIRHPQIRAVSFTGSDRAGSIVASIAASEIKPAVLELGGSDPCIVLADADLDDRFHVSKLHGLGDRRRGIQGSELARALFHLEPAVHHQQPGRQSQSGVERARCIVSQFPRLGRAP